MRPMTWCNPLPISLQHVSHKFTPNICIFDASWEMQNVRCIFSPQVSNSCDQCRQEDTCCINCMKEKNVWILMCCPLYGLWYPQNYRSCFSFVTAISGAVTVPLCRFLLPLPFFHFALFSTLSIHLLRFCHIDNFNFTYCHQLSILPLVNYPTAIS
jgi:hypothetical protein